MKAFLYGLAGEKRTIRGISRCIQTSVAQMLLHLKTSISYATPDRFWHQLSQVAERIFEHLVDYIKRLDIFGNYQAADSTSIETLFMDDPDATWSYDTTKKKYHFLAMGSSLLLMWKLRYPLLLGLFNGNKHQKRDCVQVILKAFSIKKPRVFLADAGFDSIDFQKEMMDERILPIITYNPRNASKPASITYQVEQLVKQQTTNVTFNQKALKKTFRRRASVENTNNVLKQRGLKT